MSKQVKQRYSNIYAPKFIQLVAVGEDLYALDDAGQVWLWGSIAQVWCRLSRFRMKDIFQPQIGPLTKVPNRKGVMTG